MIRRIPAACEMDGCVPVGDRGDEQYWHCEERPVALVDVEGSELWLCLLHAAEYDGEDPDEELVVEERDDAKYLLRLAAEVSARRILAAWTVVPVMSRRCDTRFATGTGSDDEWADSLDMVFRPDN